jgi:hypothetical protein
MNTKRKIYWKMHDIRNGEMREGELEQEVLDVLFEKTKEDCIGDDWIGGDQGVEMDAEDFQEETIYTQIVGPFYLQVEIKKGFYGSISWHL